MNPDNQKTLAGLITGFFVMVGGWLGLRSKKAEVKKAEVEAEVETNKSDNDRAVHEKEIEAKQKSFDIEIQRDDKVRQLQRIENLEHSIDVAHKVVSDLQDKIMLLFEEKSNLRTKLIEATSNNLCSQCKQNKYPST